MSEDDDCSMPVRRTVRRKIVSTSKAPAAVGAYNQAVRVGRTLYVSGQLGLDRATGSLVAGGVVPQARCAMANMEAVLKHAGGGLKDLVRTTILLRDMSDFASVNAVYEACLVGDDGEDVDGVGGGPEGYHANLPARAAFQVSSLPKGAAVEIEAVAVLGTPTVGSVLQCK